MRICFHRPRPNVPPLFWALSRSFAPTDTAPPPEFPIPKGCFKFVLHSIRPTNPAVASVSASGCSFHPCCINWGIPPVESLGSQPLVFSQHPSPIVVCGLTAKEDPNPFPGVGVVRSTGPTLSQKIGVWVHHVLHENPRSNFDLGTPSTPYLTTPAHAHILPPPRRRTATNLSHGPCPRPLRSPRSHHRRSWRQVPRVRPLLEGFVAWG